MSTVAVSDGTTLHYREKGHGRPLVLLHGWGFSGKFFDGSIDRLAQHSRVIALDPRTPATATECRDRRRTCATFSKPWTW